MMGERPILFSSPMVRALLDGRKTMTRRILKRQPKTDRNGMIQFHDGGWFAPHVAMAALHCAGIKLPYEPGMRLWVREAHAILRSTAGDETEVIYREEENYRDAPFKWKPSIHMPKWASRLTLEVTAVKIERLQDISEEDAKAEGMPEPYYGGCDPPWDADPEHGETISRVKQFRNLWNGLNGKDAWEANPWVTAVTFKVHHRNIATPPTPESTEA